MTEFVCLLAVLGAYRVVRRVVIIGHWFWKSWNDKPTPGLFSLRRGPMRGIHG